ncbi:MAG: hypothetical protein FWD15_05295 [Alphaproteobacteria bacterium]|nr:hypothetical protein [Alphaproteobacteria bacterium]
MTDKISLLANARVALVQFIYSATFAGAEVSPKNLRTFMSSDFMREAAGEMDMGTFGFLSRGIVKNLAAVDVAVKGALAKGATDLMTMAILRAGAFEILFAGGKTPRSVLVSEYTNIASGFLPKNRIGLVNAALAKLTETKE